ncbi:hypothetical protein EC957_000854 [Mortierella hygrophila]|uniref:ADF-H domain-containing protein n=1 Tax=Mortierella hygrophila TaxID=979708 RepID=A0A9P6F5L5_9FUNG|nr:hypothetical protein EC957_000854 [Mortierella hygrophila]
MSRTCDIDPALLEKLEAFRFAKRSEGNAALICMIDKRKLLIVEEEVEDDEGEAVDMDNLSIEVLASVLPTSTPRYIVLSYGLKHDDGRQSYPLVFLYYSPKGVKPEFNVLYASSKTYFQNKVGLGKAFDLQDTRDLTDDWLRAKLLK